MATNRRRLLKAISASFGAIPFVGTASGKYPPKDIVFGYYSNGKPITKEVPNGWYTKNKRAKKVMGRDILTNNEKVVLIHRSNIDKRLDGDYRHPSIIAQVSDIDNRPDIPDEIDGIPIIMKEYREGQLSHQHADSSNCGDGHVECLSGGAQISPESRVGGGASATLGPNIRWPGVGGDPHWVVAAHTTNESNPCDVDNESVYDNCGWWSCDSEVGKVVHYDLSYDLAVIEPAGKYDVSNSIRTNINTTSPVAGYVDYDGVQSLVDGPNIPENEVSMFGQATCRTDFFFVDIAGTSSNLCGRGQNWLLGHDSFSEEGDSGAPIWHPDPEFGLPLITSIHFASDTENDYKPASQQAYQATDRHDYRWGAASAYLS